MQCHLVVVRAFGAYAKGEPVTDAETIAQILAGENARDVVRVRTDAQEG